MKRIAAILIAVFFTASTEAQTTWTHHSTEDAVWTEVAEDTATVYLVHGMNDYNANAGQNTLCRHIAKGLNVSWGYPGDQKPPEWPSYVMRGANLVYKQGNLRGVRMNKCWADEWTLVAEEHSDVGSSGKLEFDNGSGSLVVIAHVVASRSDLPTSGSSVETHDPDVEPSDPEPEPPETPETDEDAGITFEDASATSAEDEAPEKFALEQNYPNPFNPSTTIAFELDRAQYVKLAIYNQEGRWIRDLTAGMASKGRHTISFDAADLAAGTYVYMLWMEDRILTNTMTLVK